jgi:hypothetical protein
MFHISHGDFIILPRPLIELRLRYCSVEEFVGIW